MVRRGPVLVGGVAVALLAFALVGRAVDRGGQGRSFGASGVWGVAVALAFPLVRQVVLDVTADCGRPPVGAPTGLAVIDGDPPGAGVQPGPGPAGTPRPLWQFLFGAGYGDPDRVVIADGVVYVARTRDFDYREPGLFALDARTGAVRWSRASVVTGDLAVAAGGVVYVGEDGSVDAGLVAVGPSGEPLWRSRYGGAPGTAAVVDRAVYAYDADGLLGRPLDRLLPGHGGGLVALDPRTGGRCWRVGVGDVPRDAPLAAADGLVYAVAPGQVTAVEAVGGRVRWRFSPPSHRPYHSAVVGSQPYFALADGTLYVVLDDAGVYALDAATGRVRWRFSVADPRPPGPYLSKADPIGALTELLPMAMVVADGTVYVVDNANALFALDGATGRVRWLAEEPGMAVHRPPAVGGGAVYLDAGFPPAAWVWALDAATGAERWREPGGGTPSLAGDAVYVADPDALRCLDAATGAERWRVPLFQAESVAPAVVDGVVYVAANPDRLHAVGVAESEPTGGRPQATPDPPPS